MNVYVYTAVFGGHDTLLDSNDYFICMTDEAQEARGWDYWVQPRLALSPRRDARMRKILAHVFLPEAKYSIWFDGNVTLLADPDELCKIYLKNHDIALFAHPARWCVYQEAREVTRLRLDEPAIVEQQMVNYLTAGYPRRNGLAETRVILRKHTERIVELNTVWWNELSNHSHRDQLSFDFACWKCGVKYNVLPGKSFENEGIATWTPHRRV